jgi:hypothetical protein
MLSMKKWKMQESAYGEKASKLRTWIGIVTGGLRGVVHRAQAGGHAAAEQTHLFVVGFGVDLRQ